MPASRFTVVLATVVMASVAALVLLVGTANPVHAEVQSSGFGIRLVDIPTERADDPRAHTYVIDHVAPGSTIVRRVEISNGTGGELTVSLYPAAAAITAGEFQFADGRSANALASWAQVDPPLLTLREGEKAQATLTIAVPGDEPAGERYGVVWAEARSDGGGVSALNRVGIRMYLSVGAGAEPTSSFEIHTLMPMRDETGRPGIEASVENTGQRALDLTGHVELTDGPGGVSAGPFALELGTTLAPGETAPATVLLDPDLPDGPWTATMTIRSGTIERQARAEITFPHHDANEGARSGPPVAAEPVPDGRTIVRIGLAGVISALVAGGLVLLFLNRRRRLQAGLPTGFALGVGAATRPRRVRRPEPVREGPPQTPPRPSDGAVAGSPTGRDGPAPSARARQPREPRRPSLRAGR